MAGIVGQNGRHTAGHAFHRHQVGAPFAAVGKQRHVHLAQHAGHLMVGNGADIDELMRRHAIGGDPFRDAALTVLAQRDRLQRGIAIDRQRRDRPGRMPGGDQHRLGMALGEGAEGQQHQVLGLAMFDLAAAEDGETSLQNIGARRRVKQRRIDALDHRGDISHAIGAQHLFAPARPGQDHRIVLADFGGIGQPAVLEENRSGGDLPGIAAVFHPL